MNSTYLLKWYLVFTLTMIMFFVSGALGIFDIVWEGDLTKLSFSITALFFLTSLKCGNDIRKLSTEHPPSTRSVEFGWFMSEVFLSLGMVGTIIGFIFIMKDFATVNFNDVSTIQELIKNLGAGVSTALYTTLFGLIASILTKVQYFIFEEAAEKNAEE